MPRRKASAKTATSGRNKIKSRNSAATAIKTARTHNDSSLTRAVRNGGIIAASDITEPPAVAGLQRTDEQQQRERQCEHDGRDHGRTAIIELFQPDHDQERRDLRYKRQVPRHEDDRAVFANAAREGERKTGEQGGRYQRKHDGEDRAQATGAEQRRGFLDLLLAFRQYRLNGADHEWQA